MLKSRKILISAGSIVAFFVVVLSIIYLLTNSMATTVQKQLDALRTGDIEKAYSYTSKDFKNATSLQDFHRFVDLYPLLSNNKEMVFDQTETHNDEGMVKGTLFARNGASMPIQFMLVQEQNEWRILGIEVNPEDAVNGKKDNNDEAANAESSELTNSYDNQESRYTMKYPASWEYEKSGDGTVIFSGRQGTHAYFSTVNIQTVLTKKSGGDFNTVTEFMDDIKHQARSQSPGVKFLENGSISIPERNGGKDKGEYTVFTYKYKGKEFKQWQVVVLRNDGQVFYAWAYTSPVEQFAQYHDVAKSMLDSWLIY